MVRETTDWVVEFAGIFCSVAVPPLCICPCNERICRRISLASDETNASRVHKVGATLNRALVLSFLQIVCFPLLPLYLHCPVSCLVMMWKTAVLPVAFCSLAAAYSPLVIKNLITHQPIGNPEGQTNYYRIQFDVTSSNGGASSSTTCQTYWGDNSWVQPESYSMAVPTGKWIACGANDFRFQLFPYFSIGNFSLAVQQNFSDAT